MEWWQMAGLMGTMVLTGTAVATFGWRVLRQETDKLRRETENLREESRTANDRIGSEIAQLRDGQASLREGMGEIRGELRGLAHSVLALREDFRAHVLAGAD